MSSRNNIIFVCQKVRMSRMKKFPRMLIERLNFFTKNQRTDNKDECSKPSEKKSSNLKLKLKKWTFNLSGYNKYGLYTDDVVMKPNHPVVVKALTRLPADVLDARNYRLMRAMQVDFLKIHLPKEEWITFEEDYAYRYLTPYINEVEAEMREIKEFGCVNYRRGE